MPLMSGSLRNGVIAGALTIALYSIVYLIDKSQVFSLLLYWGTVPVTVFFMYRAAVYEVGYAAGSLYWRELIRAPFGVFVVSGLMFWIFYYLLFTFDSEMAALSMARQLKALDVMQEYSGGQLTEAQIVEARREIESSEGRFSLTNLAFSFAKGILGGFLIALIIAIATRGRSDGANQLGRSDA